MIVYFAGYFEIDNEDVELIHPDTGEVKTAAEWLSMGMNISNFIIKSFISCLAHAQSEKKARLMANIKTQ